MMRRTILFLLLLCAQLVFGQSANFVKIPGTKCSLIPPTGFTLSSTFGGFQDAKTGASIMVNELPAPYQTIADGFTATNLKTRNMSLLEKKAIEFNGSQATLVTVSQPANGTTYLKLILIFGSQSHTVLVNGIYPEASVAIAPKLKDALLSTVYDVKQQENPADAVNFIIDTKDTGYKPARYLSGGLTYTKDGVISAKKPSFVVANSFSKIEVHNQRDYAIERVKNLPAAELYAVKQVNEVTIDNLKGFEIVAEDKSGEALTGIRYHVMLFDPKGVYFIMVGEAKEDLQANLALFKKLSHTFKRK